MKSAIPIRQSNKLVLRTLVALSFCGAWLGLFSGTRLWAHSPAEAMAQAAQRLVASLDDTQRQKIGFPFADAQRQDWHFIPRPRLGLPLKEMQPHQQQLAYALLHSALSHRGFDKAVNIMALEQILREMEGGAARRDPQLYYVSIFGTPGPDETWAWRVEGHHLSVNITIVEGKHITGTPSFLGANPARVPSGPQQGHRVLAAEEDLARQLVNSLDDAQRPGVVIQAEAPADILSVPGRKAQLLEPMGLAAARMNPMQRQLLYQLIREYVFVLRPEMAEHDLKRIEEAGFAKVYFAWAGGTEPGQGHYYRIQGPTFIMEYDNTQNDANHIHCVWRDFQNDFGEDLLGKHYEQVPHDGGRARE